MTTAAGSGNDNVPRFSTLVSRIPHLISHHLPNPQSSPASFRIYQSEIDNPKSAISLASLSEQNHLPRLHKSPRTQLVKINSARKLTRIPTDGVHTPCLLFVHQRRYFFPKDVVHF